jgi:hypothetical protein
MAEGRAQFRRVRAFLGGRASAGHGVLRSIARPSSTRAVVKPSSTATRVTSVSATRAPSPTPQPIRVHRRSSVVQTPPTAGHGLLRPVSPSRLSPRAVHLLAGTALPTSFSAGQGVHRSLSTAGQF